MANQYLALVEETTRGTDPGSGYKFLPITGGLEPKPKFEDAPRVEFRGQDTRLGNTTVVRKSKSWAQTLETFLYPIDIVGTLFKHALGYAGTRSAVDTSGYKGIIYPPAAAHYAPGGNLAGKGITSIPNTDLDGVTKAQVYGGGRVKGFKLDMTRPDDVKLTFDLMGGPFIGAPGQTATAGASFTTINPFNSDDVLCYSGSGISRTGTAPNFTDIAVGTMQLFNPDTLSLSFEGGIEDKDILDGTGGPNKTEVTGQVKATLEIKIDFTDPATGLSSYDEFVAQVAGVRTQSFLLKLTGPDLAGNATAYHQYIFDLPLMLLEEESVERNSTGAVAKATLKFSSLYSATAGYPIGILTVDKVSAY